MLKVAQQVSSQASIPGPPRSNSSYLKVSLKTKMDSCQAYRRSAVHSRRPGLGWELGLDSISFPFHQQLESKRKHVWLASISKQLFIQQIRVPSTSYKVWICNHWVMFWRLWGYQALSVTSLRAYASGRSCQKISTPVFVSEQWEFIACVKMIIIEKWWG